MWKVIKKWLGFSDKKSFPYIVEEDEKLVDKLMNKDQKCKHLKVVDDGCYLYVENEKEKIDAINNSSRKLFKVVYKIQRNL